MSGFWIAADDGARLHVIDEGSGEPSLVFLHGAFVNGRFFQKQREYFAAHTRVVIPDFRGHGESDKVLSGHTVRRYARDVRSVLETLKVERPILVGWSMGAFVALEYVKEYGDGGRAGLAIGNQPPSDFAWPDYGFGGMNAEQLRDFIEQLNENPRELFEFAVPYMLHDPDPETVAWMVEEMLKLPPAAAASIMASQTLRDYRPYYPSVRKPCLVLFGADPKMTSPEAGKYIAERVQNGTLRLFERSSHCPFWEEPERFNRALHDFLLSCGGTAAGSQESF